MGNADMGSRIREEREKKDIKLAQLAQMVGISVSFMGHIERGSRNVSIKTLVNIANALNVGTNYLLNGNPELNGTNDYGDISQDPNPNGKKAVLNEITRYIKDNWDDWVKKNNEE